VRAQRVAAAVQRPLKLFVRRLGLAHSSKVLRARIWWHRRHSGGRFSMLRAIYAFAARLRQLDGALDDVQRSRNRLGFVTSCWLSQRQTEERRVGRACAWHGGGMRFAWFDIGSSDGVPLRVRARHSVYHRDGDRNGCAFGHRHRSRNSSGHLEMTPNNWFERSRGLFPLSQGAGR